MTKPPRTVLEGTLPVTTWFHRSLRRFQRASEWMVLVVGFSIPLATTLGEALVGLYVYCLISAWELPTRLKIAWRNRVCRWFLLMTGLVLLGGLWSTGPWRDVLHGVLKHREFLYMPLFLTAFRQPWTRAWGLRAFVAGASLLLALSYYEFLSQHDLGLASTVGLGQGMSAGYVIFKDRIIHNLLISFLSYLVADGMIRSRRWRWVLAPLLLACLGNLLFLVQGRTGYVVTGALMLLLFYQHCGRKGLLYAGVALPLLGGIAYAGSSVVRDRVDATISQVRHHANREIGKAPDPRLEFYETSLRIFARHPLVGAGTGSFVSEYQREARLTGARPTADPHCEYLVVATQWGLAGLTVFLGIFVVSWRASRELGQAERHVAQGMLVSIGVGSLFNSLLLGFTGGLFFSYFAALCFASLAETTAKNVTVPPLLADGKTGSAPPADDESHARAA
jgi:O-antigen ligase